MPSLGFYKDSEKVIQKLDLLGESMVCCMRCCVLSIMSNVTHPVPAHLMLYFLISYGINENVEKLIETCKSYSEIGPFG